MRPKFKNYIFELCEGEVMHEPEELNSIIRQLQSYWQG